MFENMTYEYLLDRALSYVSKDFDKRQGSVIYDALAPFCAELAQVYIALDIFLNETFADTASRKYLIKRAAEKGLSPDKATYAVVIADMTGNFTLEKGIRFNCDDLNYYYTGIRETTGEYCLRCETAGTAGNLTYGTLIPIDNVKGLESAEICGIAVSARDEETTEDFRKRYFDSFENQAFGGNRKDYIEKMKALNKDEKIYNNGGIGGVKLYRTPRGGGTVDVFFTNSSNEKPSDVLVGLVQTAVDPTVNKSDGMGFAPIGHSVAVNAVSQSVINFDLIIELDENYTVEDIKQSVQNVIDDYLKSLCECWEDNENIVVYRFTSGAKLLNIGGIKNVNSILLNNSYADIVLDKNGIPVRGDINVTKKAD